MIKFIHLSNGTTVNFDPESQEGYDKILEFYESKFQTLVNNYIVPFHDKDDLKQICRLKLLDALNTYNPKKKTNFSTYLYTILNRKMFQMTIKYKTKKYSPFIENDNYINMNHTYDKKTMGQYLQVDKNKCPLNKQCITNTMCTNCPHHVRYERKKIKKGKQKNKTENFSLCKYYKEIMFKRGESTTSLDKINAQDHSLLTTLSCIKQKRQMENYEFNLQFEELKNHMDKKHFEILEKIISGYNKSEIIEDLDLTNLEFNKILEKISRNKYIIDLFSIA